MLAPTAKRQTNSGKIQNFVLDKKLTYETLYAFTLTQNPL